MNGSTQEAGSRRLYGVLVHVSFFFVRALLHDYNSRPDRGNQYNTETLDEENRLIRGLYSARPYMHVHQDHILGAQEDTAILT